MSDTYYSANTLSTCALPSSAAKQFIRRVGAAEKIYYINMSSIVGSELTSFLKAIHKHQQRKTGLSTSSPFNNFFKLFLVTNCFAFHTKREKFSRDAIEQSSRELMFKEHVDGLSPTTTCSFCVSFVSPSVTETPLTICNGNVDLKK